MRRVYCVREIPARCWYPLPGNRVLKLTLWSATCSRREPAFRTDTESSSWVVGVLLDTYPPNAPIECEAHRNPEIKLERPDLALPGHEI